MPQPGNMRRFVNSCISMLHSSEMICDRYPAGFIIYSSVDILSVSAIIVHPIEGKINQETLIWLCGNTRGPMVRQSFGHLSLDSSGALIKYFRISVSELWYYVNIFVIVVELFITMMSKFLVPQKLLSGRTKVQGMDRIRLFHKFLKRNYLDPAYGGGDISRWKSASFLELSFLHFFQISLLHRCAKYQSCSRAYCVEF